MIQGTGAQRGLHGMLPVHAAQAGDGEVLKLPLENQSDRRQGASVKTFNAHFDGKVIVLDEPAQLKPNAKVKVIPPDEDAPDPKWL